MPVFISYQRADEPTALRLRKYLSSQNIDSFLDIMEPLLTRENSDNVTQIIRSGIHKCTHLMAVVSDSTRYSWWVPFEIGAATEIDRRISTFRIGALDLPHFLKIWPVLTRDSDLAEFVRAYKQDALALQASKAFTDAARATIKSASDFHNTLRGRLGQP
jgi:hypothetical protein